MTALMYKWMNEKMDDMSVKDEWTDRWIDGDTSYAVPLSINLACSTALLDSAMSEVIVETMIGYYAYW